MTKKQRKEHKMGNALRRATIMKLARTADPRDRSHWANMGVGQKGKYGKD